MNLAVLFLSAFLVSYLGAIPPGAINLSVLQYTLQGRRRAALSFALATALIEYLYVILALKFALYFNENESIAQHFKLFSSSVLLLLGLLSLLKKPKHIIQPSAAEFRHAFQKGALVGLANPLIIPFWLVMTAYLQSMQWIALTDQNMWLYAGGAAMGGFLFLWHLIRLSGRLAHFQDYPFLVYRLPGLVLLGLGLWGFIS